MDNIKIKNLFIFENATLKQAMQKLNETALKILFVVRDNYLIATVTDGDIRRGLIKGLKFTDEIEKIMFKEYNYIYEHEHNKTEKAKTLMLENSIEQIPVIDKQGRIMDVILWTDIFGKIEPLVEIENLTNVVVIMAGGKGTRLDPFTRILPKPLIPIGTKPIIEIIMDTFSGYGLRSFIFTLNYKKEYIRMFLMENNFAYKIDFVEENLYMGTAGSLSLLKNKISETFIVSNCDIILNTDYCDVLRWHKCNNNMMTLIACHKEIKIPYGILEIDNGVLHRFVEKPSYDVLINTGVYVLEPEVISLIPDNEYMDMNTLIDLTLKKGKVSVYPIHDGWFDIGQWEEYKNSIKALEC